MDTIAALSTPEGKGGVALVRISGADAVDIAARVFRTKSKPSLTNAPSRSLLFGTINNFEGEQIDEVLVSVFRAPHSFTGETTVEISCHGSLFIQQAILQLLVMAGARMATPGEFTQRAFLNGKMDLAQAEAVGDLIAAEDAAAHRVALQQMRGGFSKELQELRDRLLEFVSQIELELDFADEDVVFADREEMLGHLTRMSTVIERLIESFAEGNAIKNGIPVAIVGAPNAGKSTLLNLLVHDGRALVSPVAGTTRDAIEDTIYIKGVLFRFIDTAGLRETKNTVESLGIERTLQKIDRAQIILWLEDVRAKEAQINARADKIAPRMADKKKILVFNKIDAATPGEVAQKERLQTAAIPDKLFISALRQMHIDRLEAALLTAAQRPKTGTGEVIVTNVRHFEALKNARQALKRVENGLLREMPTVLLAQDIRECMHYLGEITGDITTDEILESIFSRFCIGK
jgi:tRNA modification GTPase